ncbi:hypothetical protein G7054_g584 [Neopestalotiopsis clavispora]|nr:hypothetical protein G7054_g584 [Neopestalotiopsis clavispora]
MTVTRKSAFAAAIDDYLLQPSRKKRADFIQQAIDNTFSVDADQVQIQLMTLADDAKQKTGRRLLWPIFEAVCDYDAVISTLVQADPMPSALIWGGLKAFLDCFKRYKSSVEKMETHLKRLTNELGRMREYEDLFPKSEIMHELLVQNYIHIIQFWVKAERFCSSSTLTMAAKSVTSTSTKRLTEVIEAISATGNEIAKMVPIIQERLRRGDKEDIINEQRNAEMMLSEIIKFKAQQRQESKRLEILSWLRQNSLDPNESNEGNYRHQRNGESVLIPGSGQWLLENTLFQQWIDPTTQVDTVWLHGDPGMGKSVICARAVEEVKTQNPLATVAFQYYSFDEDDDHPTLTYRNLASQLFRGLYEHDILDDLIDITRFPDTEVAFQTFIELLVGEAKQTYIFIDGIDEKAVDAHGKTQSKRWANARSLLRFLIKLAEEPGSRLKIWCSSQDQQQIRDELSALPTIHMSESTNSQDIEEYFAIALRKKFEARFAKFDAESKDFVLEELKSQARGNFLWASLMIRTIENARSLKDLKDKLKEGLPEDFQNYLMKQVKALPRTTFVVQILSILTYAIRPLKEEELCEAIQVCETEPGSDLSEDTRIVSESIIESCAPLVRLDTINVGKSNETRIFALCHGSVKSFLMRNPIILQTQGKTSTEGIGSIEPSLFADICLQYLQQPRYTELMRLHQDEKFFTHCGQDVVDHPFLAYCAKYWAQHLDKVQFTPHMGRKIEEFLRSKQFVICLQAQTLFVGGLFNMWFNQETQKVGMLRAFPHWFAEHYPSGKEFEKQYYSAIREWAYYLDTYANTKSSCAGQLDHCHWQSLGPSNFLSSIPSRIKSFVLVNGDIDTPRQSPISEYIDPKGKYFTSFVIPSNRSDYDNNHVIYDRWGVKKSHKPKLKDTRRLTTSEPLPNDLEWSKIPKAPCNPPDQMLRISEDGQVLHTRNAIYARNKDQAYDKIERYFESMESVEEIGSGSGIMALASRKRYARPATAEVESASIQVIIASPSSESSDSSSDTGSDSTSNSSNNDGSTNSGMRQRNVQHTAKHPQLGKRGERQGSTDALSSSSDSIIVESDKNLGGSDISVLEAVIDDTLTDFGSNFESIPFGSARESWSEASSEAPSNEIIEEAAWNDWNSDDDPFDRDHEILGDDVLDIAETQSISSASSNGSFLTPGLDKTGDSGAAGSRSLWTGKFDPASEYDKVPPKTEQLKELESKLQLSLPSFRGDRICQLQVISSASGGLSEHRIFSFSQRSMGLLLESPPAFHPNGDLVVWPTGCGEILFGDVKNKTYFVRRQISDRPNECLVSVKVSFSPCGQYLHLATIWAQKCPCSDDERCPVCQRTRGWGVCLRPEYTPTFAHPTIHLVLHLTTHKLSKSKLARCPPKLVHSSILTFDSGFEDLRKIYEHPLQFTLTWTLQCLYVTTNNRLLQIFRLPLFNTNRMKDISQDSLSQVCENDGEVFLPDSTKYRRVHFFPAEQGTPKPKATRKSTSRKNHEPREETVATIVLSSKFDASAEISATASTDSTRDVTMQPQVIYLTKSQLGDFTPLEFRQYGFKERMKAESDRGGQLLGMFEEYETCKKCGRVLTALGVVDI